MFEKSKSEITFKEFEKKINEVNIFENDWGHFCDPDDNNNNNNNIFQPNLYYQKKPKIIPKINPKIIPKINPKSNTEKIEKIIKIETPFVDIEKLENKEKLDYKEEEDDNIYIIETVVECVKKVFITFTMFYFIFKII